MIIGTNRDLVIENIRSNAESGMFHNKVEINDPVLTESENRAITDNYLASYKTVSYKLKRGIATLLQQALTFIINRDTVVLGLDKIPKNLGGVIITSNHFSPLENTAIKHLTNIMKKRLAIISQSTNFKMKGSLGFLMNYANTIPITADPKYLAGGFYKVLKEKLIEKEEAILLYPEQEMWFNYRKPRPPKKGAYFFASKLNVPIVSCFVEMVDMDKDDNNEFKKVKYVLHILDVLYPDKNKDTKANSEYLAIRDYELKKACYEECYKKELTYTFDSSDIAGWKVE